MKKLRMEKNNCVLFEEFSVMLLFVFGSSEQKDQDCYANNDKNEIDRDEVGNQVNSVNGNHSR